MTDTTPTAMHRATTDPVLCFRCGQRFRLLPAGALVCPPCRVPIAEMRVLVCPCPKHEAELDARRNELAAFAGYEPSLPDDAELRQEVWNQTYGPIVGQDETKGTT